MDVREKKHRVDLKKNNPKLKKIFGNKTSRTNDGEYGSSHRDEVNLDRKKKHGQHKKNIAQNRLDRLRNTLNVKNGFRDKIEKLQGIEMGHRQKKSDVMRDKFLLNTILKHNYSADARIKKIRQESLKLLAREKAAELLNCSAWKTCDESCLSSENQTLSVVKKRTVPQSIAESKVGLTIGTIEPRNTIHMKVDAVMEDDSMDVDMDLPEIKATNHKSTMSHIDKSWIDDDESNVQFINDEISKLRNESYYLALHENYVPDVVLNLDVPVGDIFIVVDTNIFLAHLHFLNKLLKCDLPPYKYPVIVVPWPVIQEIDYTMKKENKRLSSSARVANHFIYDCLKKKHPRFFGQSLENFKANFQNAVNIDDFILQYCLKFVSMKNDVILVTNDINLCNKSMINHLKAFTKNDFEKSFGISDK